MCNPYDGTPDSANDNQLRILADAIALVIDDGRFTQEYIAGMSAEDFAAWRGGLDVLATPAPETVWADARRRLERVLHV